MSSNKIVSDYQWESIREVFLVLNESVLYVVLRGEENLCREPMKEHEDVDLLVNDINETMRVLNGYKIVYSSPVRPKVFVKTKYDGSFIFDLWSSKQPYHSIEWHDRLFSTREFTGLFYKLNDENKFYTLIYHCIINKKKIAADYLLQLEYFFKLFGLERVYNKLDYETQADLYYQVLFDYMQQQGYEITYAQDDTHCYYNSRIKQVSTIISDLKTRTDVNNIRPYKVNETDLSDYFYFIGFIGIRKVLVKYGGIDGICRNEVKVSNLLSNKDSKHFLKPIDFDLSQKPYVIFDYFSDECIYNYYVSTNHAKHAQLILQLTDILNALSFYRVSHRSINLDNLIINNDNLILLNFQYSIGPSSDKQLICLNNNISKTLNLGGNYRYSRYKWCDVYSANELLADMGVDKLNDNKLELGVVVSMPLKLVVFLEIKRYFFNLKLVVCHLIHKIKSIYDE